MIKLVFINNNDPSDKFILPFFKAYVHNFDISTYRVFGRSINNKITFYENISPYSEWWLSMKNFPTYAEMKSDTETRTYHCKQIPNLIFRINFYKYVHSDKESIKRVSCSCSLDYKNLSVVLMDSINLTSPQPSPYGTGYANMPFTYCFYDFVNEITFNTSCNARISDAFGTYNNRGLHYCTMHDIPIKKGTIYEYGQGDITIDEQLSYNLVIDSSYRGKQVTVNLSTAYFEKERNGSNPTLYEVIKDYIKKYPDGDDEDYDPDGDGDDDSDDIIPNPMFPTSATGFVAMYSPTQAELKSLAEYMWSKDFLDIFVKLLENPYESIISIKNVCCNFNVGSHTDIILGNVNTGVQAAQVTQQYQQIDCGTINVTRYFGNFLDFNPYTSIKIYLPFVGYKELDVDEVMGASLHLYYNIDLLTGSCVALINVSKNIKGTELNSVLYQYDGIIANEIPVTAADYSQVVSSIIRGVATTAAAIGVTAATGGAGAGVGGALLGSAVANETATAIGTTMVVNSAIDTITSKVNVQHGGNLGGSMGALANKQPYLIITRVIPKNPSNYAKLHGIPSNSYKKLSSLTGFTKMQDIQIKSTIGSVDETEEIKQLLLGGVVI